MSEDDDDNIYDDDDQIRWSVPVCIHEQKDKYFLLRIFKRFCVCIVHHLNKYDKTGNSGSTSAPQVDGCTLALPDSKVSVSLFYLGKNYHHSWR